MRPREHQRTYHHKQTRETELRARARWQVIGIELRRSWNDIVREPVPVDMLDLLRRLDEQEREIAGLISSDALGG